MSVKKKFAIILAAIALVLSVAAISLLHGAVILPEAEANGDLKIEKLSDDSKYLQNGYIDRYGIPTAQFQAAHNGGEEPGAPFSNVFDRNFGSVWRSQLQFNANDKAGTTNYVEAAFSSPMLLDRILYQSDSSWYDRGYPISLRISYVKTGESDYTVLQELSSAPTSDVILITLSKSQTVDKIKIEWTDVNRKHRTCAAASEIIFLQPHSEAVEAVQNIFKDYAQLELADGIKTVRDIEALRNGVKQFATYSTELSALLNRAEQVLAGTVKYDSRREMSTNPQAENVITRNGDVAGYARGTLKMAWFGTNRQVTGVSVTPEDVLTVYVTGDANDPLPSIVITQFWGSWSSWRSGEYKLRLGKNVITPANYVKPGFTTNTGDPIPSGGPVYITNPYTPSNQSSNVRIYLEGGTLIPVFRKGGDEGLYYNRLGEYARYVAADKADAKSEGKVEKAVDVTEIVSRNIILTVRASLADVVYNTEKYSVEAACKGWDDYVGELLVSDGVVIDENNNKYGGKYDDRAKYLNCNIRLMQPYGAAYAHIEHVGIQVSWERGALIGSGFGWGYTHELGHMMDIGERTVSECSNNMLSKYNETAMEKVAQRGDFAKTTAALAPDIRTESSYWNTNRGNFIIWWLIESFHIGYWPKLENLYRYESVSADYGKMSATEKQVYLSSLSVGYDLSYYFERWGYNLSTSDFIFTQKTASSAFKSLMAEAKKANRIRDGYQPKIWYLDAAEYLERQKGEDTTKLYSSADVPAIEAVTKCSSGYNLFMSTQKCGSSAHLGFEIWEGKGENKRVIGFSYGQAYTDTTEYKNGYVPVYTVVAYDRALQASAESASTGIDANDRVCQIKNQSYSTLYDAIVSAADGDEIVLLKDCHAANLVIDKNVTIRAEGNRTISKVGAQALFTVEQGKTLTLKGSASSKLILDGRSFMQDSALVRAAGNFKAEYCVFQNNSIKQVKGGNGGAVQALGSAGSQMTLSHCEFKNNSAMRGGAIYIQAYGATVLSYTDCTFTQNNAVDGGAVYVANSNVKLENCTFTQNSASNNGGAIAVCEGSVASITDCTVQNNEAVCGGGMYIDGATTLTNGKITGNSASDNGGAIYYSATYSARFFALSGATLSANSCNGSSVYLSGSSTLTDIDISDEDCGYAVSAASGSLRFEGGKISGDVFISESCKVSASKSLFTAHPNKTITFFTDKRITEADGENAEAVLLTTDFTLEGSAADNFKSAYGEVAVGRDKKSLCIALETLKVTLNVGNTATVMRFLIGQEFTLPADSGSEQTYIASWQMGGNSYSAGESFTVTQDMAFTANIKNKTRITYHFGNSGAHADVTDYYIPGDSYTIRNFDIEKFVLNGWEYNNATYLPFTTAVAEGDVTYTANLTAKLKVEYYIYDLNGENPVLIGTKYHAFGERIKWLKITDDSIFDGNMENYLPTGKSLEGYCLSGSDALIDFDTFNVTGDLKLTAVITDNPVYITYMISLNGTSVMDSKTDLAKPGTSYTLSLDLIPYGYHPVALTMFDADGEQVPFDSQEDLNNYVIESVDSFYYIVYADVAKNVYDVTYQYNGEDFKTEQKEYETKIVLEEPEDLPENYHFTSYLIGKPELVLTDEGVYEMQNVELSMQVGTEIIINENTVINILVYIEGQEKLPEEQPSNPDNPGNPSNPDNPNTPDYPGSTVKSGCAGCGYMDIGGGLTLGGGVTAALVLLIAVSHVLRRKKSNM